MSKLTLVTCAIVLATFLAGCNTTLPGTVKRADVDSLGLFNGTWILHTNDSSENCEYNANPAYVRVKGGVAETVQGKGYVSHTGEFTIKDNSGDNTVGATRIYSGNLNDANGRVIVDYREFNRADCALSLMIEKAK